MFVHKLRVSVNWRYER